ncbi:hypothetical protein Hypma_009955 [Hypsizygus marmoreus]|uniref:Uncharacterized protein n=1 Tax=Hypsizygus marmoreus TaxID=39966 RepID=A0A369JWL9_HYPMA|nr:hypothetical protein Hypma_009955 [Hypsizygus marmoreus]
MVEGFVQVLARSGVHDDLPYRRHLNIGTFRFRHAHRSRCHPSRSSDPIVFLRHPRSAVPHICCAHWFTQRHLSDILTKEQPYTEWKDRATCHVDQTVIQGVRSARIVTHFPIARG